MILQNTPPLSMSDEKGSGDGSDSQGVKKRKIGHIQSLVIALVLSMALGIGIGIGVGASIWNVSSSSKPFPFV